ncbi:hypothetical protein HMPREF9628_01930 [Peptoanaerobacter stomatis]|uniref:Uncharacterized protein n=1 Tax=Peptoanaerobacter stomatis TaxID=796937 RepID=G9XDQ7_9FIRM|nr:hypothetical protein HMPREF9628_01930 [Peptoanaerobacter stomatis]
MNYKEMRNTIEKMANENHEDFTKALISFEKGINDKEALDKLYADYMENDSMSLLNDEFDYMIDELRESGQIKENESLEKEDNDLVNIVGNVVGEVEVVERENKNGEAFKVVNFSVVSKDNEGNKHYTNCSAYGEKGDIPKDFKQGDFVKIFGQERKSIDDNGKEHTNVRILSSKLLKAKEQMKSKGEKRIEDYKDRLKQHLEEVYEAFVRNDEKNKQTVVLAERETHDGKHKMILELNLEKFSWHKKLDGLTVENGSLRIGNQDISDAKLLRKYFDSLDVDNIFALQKETLNRAGILKPSIIDYLKKSKEQTVPLEQKKKISDIRVEIDR